MMSRRALRVWQRNFDVFLRTWKAQIAFTIIEPLMVIVAQGAGLGQFVELPGGVPYLFFLGPGIVAAYAMFSASAESSWGAYLRMEHQRTFDAMIVTPLDIDDVILGEALWGATRAVESCLAMLAVLLLFQTPLAPSAVLALPAMYLLGFMFACIGLLVISVVPSMGELNHFFSLFLTPQFLFAGVFFPVAALPEWAQAVAWFLPLTHGVVLARGLLTGDVTGAMLPHLAWVVGASAGCLLLALRLMRRRLIK